MAGEGGRYGQMRGTGPILRAPATGEGMGMRATLEGEPPGEPDKYAASALNRFSRVAGEGGRRPDEGDRAESASYTDSSRK